MIEARPLANTDKVKVEPRGQRLPYSDKALAQLSARRRCGRARAACDGSRARPPRRPAAPAPAPEPETPAAGTQGEAVDWIWPVKGKVLAAFTEATKGIDIARQEGRARRRRRRRARGLRGQGLRGYGKLVIIKHNDTWLSAYAHNDNIVVKEQQDVKRGQKIAEMGSTDADQVKLHFEVRRQGKPVDPARIAAACAAPRRAVRSLIGRCANQLHRTGGRTEWVLFSVFGQPSCSQRRLRPARFARARGKSIWPKTKKPIPSAALPRRSGRTAWPVHPMS